MKRSLLFCPFYRRELNLWAVKYFTWSHTVCTPQYVVTENNTLLLWLMVLWSLVPWLSLRVSCSCKQMLAVAAVSWRLWCTSRLYWTNAGWGCHPECLHVASLVHSKNKHSERPRQKLQVFFHPSITSAASSWSKWITGPTWTKGQGEQIPSLNGKRTRKEYAAIFNLPYLGSGQARIWIQVGLTPSLRVTNFRLNYEPAQLLEMAIIDSGVWKEIRWQYEHHLYTSCSRCQCRLHQALPRRAPVIPLPTGSCCLF